jgi:hypothetical protein
MRSLREFPYAVAALICLATVALARDEKALIAASRPATNAPDIELTGKIVKLTESTNSIRFKIQSGDVYTLVRNQKSEALFSDTNLFGRMLVIKGRVRTANTFEITGNLHSLRDGKRYEIYYYCDVCAIKSSEPGPCMCCREPVRLVEDPP